MQGDEHVEQATTIDPTDVADVQRLDGIETKYNTYSRLSIANRSTWDWKWLDRTQKTTQDAAAVVEAVASQLDLTEYQTQRAARFLSQIKQERVQGYSTAALAICLCGLAGRLDGRAYHPNNLLNDPLPSEPAEQFAEIARENDISYTALANCWSAVKGDLA